MAKNGDEIVHYLRVVSGNRITLPEDVREALNVRVGDYVRAEVEIEDKETKIVITTAA